MNRSATFNPERLLRRLPLRRELIVGALILAALLMFEVFNYSTTEYSLSDLLGGMEFMGMRWATILAIAFCGIDFAGIARVFTPEQGADEPREIWYLMAAWFLAATMNAMLTWWAVSIAILSHAPSANTVIPRETVLQIVPIFVALLVWLIRILIIGTFSVAGDHLFNSSPRRRSGAQTQRSAAPALSFNALRQSGALKPASALQAARPAVQPGQPAAFRPVPKPAPQAAASFPRPEPTYHPMSMNSGRSNYQE